MVQGRRVGSDPQQMVPRGHCGTKLCLVCMARNHACTVWRGSTELIDATTEQIENGMEKVCNYDGSNEEQFVRMTSKWLFDDKQLRQQISAVGYEYLTKEEIREQTREVHNRMMVDGRYVEGAFKIKGHSAIKDQELT